MRNVITLLTTATLIVACADDSRPTSPASRSTAGTIDLRPTNQSVSGQAKPVDQIGFTKVTVTSTLPISIYAGQKVEAGATCPAGTHLIAGGYEVGLYSATTIPPRVLRDGPNGQNGWNVGFSNEAPGMGDFTFSVFATCLS